MKTFAMFAAGLLLASVPALGHCNTQGMPQDAPYLATISSHSDAYLQKAVNTYTVLLTSPYDGIVESAIAHLAYCRMSLRHIDMKEARQAIANLAESGRTPAIRYKAYLATIVFESPEVFAKGLNVESTDSDQFFMAIASRAQKTLLGQNIK